MDLVILAAGMGSRFGGLKQIEPIDKYGNFIIDYSIYDAKQAGFDKVIFIIKEENFEIFKNTIGRRVEDKIETHYAFQSLDLIPKGYKLPSDRVKPLGTAQAILAAKDYVSDSFIIINADDFYGRDAFMVAANYLKGLKNSKNNYANVAYQVANTMTEKANGIIVAKPLDGSKSFDIPADTLVSMNMFCFTKDIMNHIEEGFVPFMEDNKNNLDSCEYLIPTVVSDLINDGVVSCEVLSTKSVWYGITYKDDKDYVVSSLENMMKNGEYPEGIWK